MDCLSLETPPASPRSAPTTQTPDSPPPPPVRRANQPKKRRAVVCTPPALITPQLTHHQSQQPPPRAAPNAPTAKRAASAALPARPSTPTAETAMFKVTIRDLFHSSVRIIVAPMLYDHLCDAIARGAGFAEAVHTLLACPADHARVVEMALQRRNAPQVLFSSQLEMGFALGSVRDGEVEVYEGMKVYTVEARLAGCM